ncbi:MAG: divergent polysaccharide deacetylase family protein [Gammaproteobacteria bacterium]|nr:divergent polysaccharide deacetylase family protein [Gammaproteobacteria bacterium]
MIAARVCLVALLLSVATDTDAGLTAARIAIIIDDLGYQLGAGQRALALPGDISYAFLPGTPQATKLARVAHENGKEVLLHLPLQAESEAHDADAMQDPIGIRLDMNRSQVRAVFASALQSVPHAVGVNGHRGSLLTRHPGHMQWLMEEIGSRDNLFFVDSYTTHKSIALQIACELDIAAVKRDVFLDPDRSAETVAREFERLLRLAKRRGTAIAIGHPHETTLAFLEQQIPLLAERNIELVRVGEFVR